MWMCKQLFVCVSLPHYCLFWFQQSQRAPDRFQSRFVTQLNLQPKYVCLWFYVLFIYYLLLLINYNFHPTSKTFTIDKQTHLRDIINWFEFGKLICCVYIHSFLKQKIQKYKKQLNFEMSGISKFLCFKWFVFFFLLFHFFLAI